MLARMRRFLRVTERFIQRSHLIYLATITIIVIFLGGLAAFVLESGNPNAAINTFTDAVWWSISTITTIGYGDIVPVSFAGRIMGMILMVVGIGIMAALISQVSAVLVESRLKRENKRKGLKDSLALEIKDRVESIDGLSSDELKLLINMIRTLHTSKAK